MRDYRNADYALNKNSESIVYGSVTGKIEITLEKFLASDPSLTEADFHLWKALSDDDYYKQDMEEYRQTWKDISLEYSPETVESPDSSPEEVVIDIPDQTMQKLKRKAIKKMIWERLTYNQRRRYQMYHAQGMTEERIAKIEGITHQAVSKGLLGTKRKIEKILENQGNLKIS